MLKPGAGFLVLFLMLVLTACRSRERVFTRQQILDHYPGFFNVQFEKKDRRISWSFTVNNEHTDNLFQGLLRNYNLYIDYLHWNYFTIDSGLVKKMIALYPDTANARRFYIGKLGQDSVFNFHFLNLATRYLEHRCDTVTGYILPPKETFTIKELIACASRFFYAAEFDTARKSIAWYICVGQNPYHTDSTIVKHPALEAFCFMTIMDSRNRDRPFQRDFRNNIKLITGQVQNIAGKKTMLNTASARMAEEMSASKDLKRMLLSAYDKRKNVLPFIIADG